MNSRKIKFTLIRSVLIAGLAAVAIQGAIGTLAKSQGSTDKLEHVRYEDKYGQTIDEAEYRRQFEKDPASVAECTRNTRTGEVVCAAG